MHPNFTPNMFIRWRRCRHRPPAAARPEVPYDPSGLSAALEELGLDAAEVVEAANTMPSTFHAAGECEKRPAAATLPLCHRLYPDA